MNNDTLEGIIIIIASGVMGALVMASGQVFVAVREIAINTRKESGGEQYSNLLSAGKLNRGLGALLLVLGCLAGIAKIFMQQMK